MGKFYRSIKKSLTSVPFLAAPLFDRKWRVVDNASTCELSWPC